MPTFKNNFSLEKIIQIFKRNPQGVGTRILAEIFGDRQKTISIFLKSHPDLFVREGKTAKIIWKLK